MYIMALDDEPLLLETLIDSIRQAEPTAEIQGFSLASAALRAIFEDGFRPNVAFLDIEMPGMTGLELAVRIKELSPCTNIVFVTGFPQYALEALQLYPSGYVVKQVTPEKIRKELDNLRFPMKQNETSRIRVQTFGNFEIFVDDIPVTFSRSRSKEVLAYLVDRQGTGATFAELGAVIWEDGIYDRSRQKQMQNYIQDIVKSLHAVNADEMIIKSRTGIMVDKSKFDCDYYRFLEGDISAINAFAGKYMDAYSWAELTVSYLDNHITYK